MLGSKLKEAIICLKNLRVTLPYPFQPAPPADGFRAGSKWTSTNVLVAVPAFMPARRGSSA